MTETTIAKTNELPFNLIRRHIVRVGRRKTAVARVRLYKKGAGNFYVNFKPLEQYFPTKKLQSIVKDPLQTTNSDGIYDISVKVSGGGKKGQAEAVRLGIARALVTIDEQLRPALKHAGFLTRDSREKERKKYGLKGRRKAPQFSKR